MLEPTNPAARLHNLLEDAGKAAKAIAPKGQPGKAKARDVWAKVLGVSADDSATLLQELAAVYRLPSEIRQQVALLPAVDDPTQLVERLPDIERAFTTHGVGLAWQQYSSTLSDAAMYGLKTCSNLINARGREPVLPSGVAEQLRAHAQDLFDEVIAATDLGVELRDFLAESLVGILRALDEYQISGVAAIDNALDLAAGRFSRKHDEGKATAEGSPLGKKVLGFLGGVALLLNVLHQANALAEDFGLNLPWQVPIAVEVVPEDLRQKALPPAPPAIEREVPDSTDTAEEAEDHDP